MHQSEHVLGTDGQLFESADVARELKITPAMVRVHAAAGRLRAAAVTPRGTRLFRPEDVSDFKKNYRRRETPRRKSLSSADMSAARLEGHAVVDADAGAAEQHAELGRRRTGASGRRSAKGSRR